MKREPDPSHDAWQPISTAPKDGTEILGFSMDSDTYGNPVPAFYVCFYGRAEWETSGYDHWHAIVPTHWVPIPKQPGTK